MPSLSFISLSPRQTKKLAGLFLNQKLPQGPLVFALSGPLGAGKTNFIQGLAKALGIKESINSPSFVVMKSFPISNNSQLAISHKRFLWHIDCWRLNQKDLEELGLKEILANSENIVCLEWAEKVKKILPKGTIRINLEHKAKNQRRISIRRF
ncbi:MAG: tRNA (adenosine(37)-N6)-threonylcarbamoyltransferase complex ATPase subunit type 1 TsaE [Patescibacteria group bacterium]